MTQLSRLDLKSKAQTVQGIIDPDALGPTLMHEHLLWDIRTCPSRILEAVEILDNLD